MASLLSWSVGIGTSSTTLVLQPSPPRGCCCCCTLGRLLPLQFSEPVMISPSYSLMYNKDSSSAESILSDKRKTKWLLYPK